MILKEGLGIVVLTIGISFIIGCKSNIPTELNIAGDPLRERILLRDNWRFMKYDSAEEADDLIYDVRPDVTHTRDDKPADSKLTEAVTVEADKQILKPWIMLTGNRFLKDFAMHYRRPAGNPGEDFPFVQVAFNDSTWEEIKIPHDWAIKGPFLEGRDAEVVGGMGRLPSPGVAWYRRKLDIPGPGDNGSFFLDIDGDMSYAMVWPNGKLIGGWPFGYSSWRLDLTPYINRGEENQLAIRFDNSNNSTRWYPGGGLYRIVWLVRTNPVHVGKWGSFITTLKVPSEDAVGDLVLTIDNDSEEHVTGDAVTRIFDLDGTDAATGTTMAIFQPTEFILEGQKSVDLNSSVTIENPRLWGPPRYQEPHMYLTETLLYSNGELVDTYTTKFGIRTLGLDGKRDMIVNGEPVFIKGVNQQHDLGALGAAFNTRAAERQMEKLREMGANAIRMAHNPPAPELLELADRMGFLVVNEMFDVWEHRSYQYGALFVTRTHGFQREGSGNHSSCSREPNRYRINCTVRGIKKTEVLIESE